MNLYSVYLRGHDGRISDQTKTGTPATAVAAFRTLLARRDLDGEPLAVVLRDQRQTRTLLYSRFDLPVQQLLPDDRIDLDHLTSEVADIATSAIVRARQPTLSPDDPAGMVAQAKSDPAMIRDFGRNGGQLSDADLAAALGYRGPGGRHTVARIAEGHGTVTSRLLLMALLDGWRPKQDIQ